jgi:hypothetical protein
VAKLVAKDHGTNHRGLRLRIVGMASARAITRLTRAASELPGATPAR